MSAGAGQPLLRVNAVLASGLASAVAATLTSSFGVAGTLTGAGLTTMIITGASAILTAYLNSVTERVKAAPGRLRVRRDQEACAPEGERASGRPGLWNNFAGRAQVVLLDLSRAPHQDTQAGPDRGSRRLCRGDDRHNSGGVRSGQ